MKRPALLWSAAFSTVLPLACGGSTQRDVLAPTVGGRCQMTLVAPGPLPYDGAPIPAELSAPRECAWSAQSQEVWLQLEPSSGQGSATLTLAAAANTLGRARSAAIQINDQRFTVTQDPAPCTYEVVPTTVSIGNRGGRASLLLTTLEGCSWTTQSSHPWVRVVSGSGGDRSGPIELAVDSNTGPERTALLDVASLLVTINQNAGLNDSSACRFSLDPGSRLIPAAGDTGSFTVSTAASCAWNPTPDQSWITITSSPNVIGPSTVTYRVEPNPSTSVRSGAIAAGTRRHVVRQEGAPRP